MDTFTKHQLWTVCFCYIFILISQAQCEKIIPDSQVRSDTGDDLECKGPWIKLHRACYKFEKNQKSWDDAQTDCEQDGGNLVSIGSVAEFNNIKAQLKKAVKKMSDLQWWVGLRKKGDKWVWSDGDGIMSKLTRWKPGEPNNGNGNEECGEMNHKMQLVDQTCSVERNFICERNKITPPPTHSTVFVTVSTDPTAGLSNETSAQPSQEQSPVTPSVTDEQKPSPTIAERPSTTQASESDETTASLEQEQSSSKMATETVSIGSTVESGSQETSTKTATVSSTVTAAPTKVPEPPKLSPFEGCYIVPDLSGNNKAGGKNSKGGSMENKFCSSMNLLDVEWPLTRAGQTANVSCGKGKGKATWKCGDHPVCWQEEPNIDECASPVFQNLLDELKPQANNSKPVTSEEAVKASSVLVDVTSSAPEMTSADVGASASVIESVANTKPKDKEAVTDIVQNVMKAGSNIVSKNKTQTWTKMTDKEKVFSASKLLVAMETATNAMADALEEPTVIETKDENIAMELHVVDVEAMDTENLVYGGEEDDASFSIPVETLRSLSKGGLAKVVFMTHYKMGEYLVTQEKEDETFEKSKDNRQSKPKPRIASHVISASLHRGQITKLPEPISFTMKHLELLKENARPLCSFWNFSSGPAGRWSQNGCQATKYNYTHTKCQCDHLTNFAILMDVEGVEIPYLHYVSLRYITYVGCIISLICLFVSWITFSCLSSLQGERNSIHKNLAFCLFVAEIVFLAGIERTENKLACSIIAGVLHFFFLAAFTWMFLEGVHIVIMLIQVFDVAKSRLKRYYLAGYGIPAIVVGVSAGIYYQGYGTETYCWLTTERYFIWSFAGPVALILLINAIILTYAMSAVCKHSEYVFTKEKNQGGSMRAWIQGCFALEVLLGLTWVFGYFYISEDTLPMAYIFTVLNSLQGLFIFIFHCILNKKVRKEYKHALRISTKSSKTQSGFATKTASLRKQSQSFPGSEKCEVFTPTP